jgi:uncharacterized membrane protein/CBS domain-containing protein
MKNPALLLGSLGLGAGLMYFLDPNRGKRRRALARDQAVHLTKTANKQLNRTAVDLRNRAQGVWFEAERLFEEQDLTDEKLNGKIRSKIGRLTSHPHQIKTEVKDGKLILKGFVLNDEEELVLNGVASICGVREVVNELEVHTSEENFPKLLGAEKRRKFILDRNKEWSTKTRVLAAAAGSGLAFWGAKKRDTASSMLASAGVGLLARSLVNKPIASFLPNGENDKVEVHKSIKIKAPREKVYEILKYPQYFPYFMSHVQKVDQTADKQFKWEVEGIAGYPVNWETEVTEVKPNELIRWKNKGDGEIGQSGELKLESINDESTRLQIEMNYEPFGGRFGHFIAGVFHRDPKSEMDDDLMRLKTYIEKGKLPHDAAVNLKRRKDMKVAEIMTEKPIYATVGMSLPDVAQRMNEYDIGSLPVIESEQHRKLVGIITDRDITVRTIAHHQNPMMKIAGEVMSENVITVTPEMSVEDCCNKMENNQIRRIVVVDEAGSLTGIVSQADIAIKAPPFETAELVRDVSAPKMMDSALVN